MKNFTFSFLCFDKLFVVHFLFLILSDNTVPWKVFLATIVPENRQNPRKIPVKEYTLWWNCRSKFRSEKNSLLSSRILHSTSLIILSDFFQGFQDNRFSEYLSRATSDNRNSGNFMPQETVVCDLYKKYVHLSKLYKQSTSFQQY